MEWTVILTGPATKSLRKIPHADHKRIMAALDEMRNNPFAGDIGNFRDSQGSGGA